jgi:hypothetical protein
MSRVGVVAVVVFAVGGCIMPRAGVEQITPQGPTAETMFKLRSVTPTAASPTRRATAVGLADRAEDFQLSA